ncbi:MAG: hypothetical protein H0V30_04130 [Chitinophagaceae bacterium]|jgi:hypothetical protein|nr:hypothetical protein [Chitinophagaceae bacterium]
MKISKFLILVVVSTLILTLNVVQAQDVPVVIDGDTTQLRTTPDSQIKQVDNDSLKNIHSPRKAAIRSALIPGWGQAYNKKYWKIPIVYGALGTTAGVFVFNLQTYKELRVAYRGKYNARVFKDSTDYFKMETRYIPISEESLRYNRNEFRRNIDYTVLVFIVLWGLNVVDATVDAHLKSFDVSPDLSLRIKPGHSELANTSGLSLVLQIGK